MHAGSCDPLLYQHRARCTLGASCSPFISPGSRDVSLVYVCMCVCVFAGHGGRSYFLGAWLSAGADYMFVGAWMWLDECEYANVCVFLSWQACASRGIGSQAFPWRVRGLGGVAVTSKGLGAHCASRPAKGGEILFMWWGLAWQDQQLTLQHLQGGCHHPGRFENPEPHCDAAIQPLFTGSLKKKKKKRKECLN